LSGNKNSVAKDSRTKTFVDGPADINISRRLSRCQVKYNKIIYELFVLTFIINKRNILKAI